MKFLMIYLIICGIGCYLVVALDVFLDMKHNKQSALITITGFLFLLCPVLYFIVALCGSIKHLKNMKNIKQKKVIIKEIEASDLTPDFFEKLKKEIEDEKEEEDNDV